mmetsp:Transcript_17301/g.20969  ORF Transcript_17301/g.20969 Transcript_17301/m.20969 type:complete len:238 (+) Transcript_17301:3-716(+)
MLDIVDYYLNNFVMIGIGCLECIAVAWVYGYEESKEKLGVKSVMIFNAFHLAALCFSALFLAVLPKHNIPIGFCMWPLFSFSGFIGAYCTSSSSSSDTFYHLVFSGGMDKLIVIMKNNEFGEKEASASYSFILHTWALLIKYIVPMLLFILLCTGASANFDDPYEGYAGAFQNIGVLEVTIAYLILSFFMLAGINLYADMEPEAIRYDEIAYGEKKTKSAKIELDETHPSDNAVTST